MLDSIIDHSYQGDVTRSLAIVIIPLFSGFRGENSAGLVRATTLSTNPAFQGLMELLVLAGPRGMYSIRFPDIIGDYDYDYKLVLSVQ